ncbi:proteasome accessory factor C [Klenkia marina]|uniref:Proteasome accessory factor C n=1 Tax=Klenkia marina TaxID=1960309 RepID=A0A1G4YN10_9ACTN|nr:WYL domain-containing protein [Klenkia marina]SCX54863.1 proteasome accessory factor C [Klenkia marina]
MSAPGTDRMTRLLALVPYLEARPDGVLLADAARDFGVTEAQVQKDLELLWVCGLPGHGPGDLIDLSFEGDRVRVTDTAGLARPLRLATDEAVALVVALRALLELPGLAETDAVSRALVKVSAAAGEPVDLAGAVTVSIDARAQTLAVVRRALETGRALHLHYYVPSRDERTERTVDPMRLLLVEGHWYLEAWCRRVEGTRLFRLDRVDDLTVLDEPAAPPEQAQPRDLDDGLYQPGEDQPLVRLRLDRSARWVADYYPVEESVPVDDPPGGLSVAVRTADPAWARRLVASLGGAARVEDPPELAQEIAEAARAALARYAD